MSDASQLDKDGVAKRLRFACDECIPSDGIGTVFNTTLLDEECLSYGEKLLKVAREAADHIEQLERGLSVNSMLVDVLDGLARRCGWNEVSSRPTVCFLEDAVKAYESARSARAPMEAIWDRFIAHLDSVDPLVLKKSDGPVPHANFIGSIDKYREIFLASALPEIQDTDLIVQDLAMTVRRLCHKISIYTEGSKDTGADIMRSAAKQSLDFLKRKGLQGSPLREDSATPPEIPALLPIGEGLRSPKRDWPLATQPAEPALKAHRAEGLPPPIEDEISRYRDTFRRELDKRMDTKHPSASPSTESHAVALREFVKRRNGPNQP